MTHEPECPMNLPIGDLPQNADCPFCPVIRIAYQRGREDECRTLNETKAYIVEPITENLRRYKLLGWYLPGQAVTHIHSDGTITLDGKVHWYGTGDGGQA